MRGGEAVRQTERRFQERRARHRHTRDLWRARHRSRVPATPTNEELAACRDCGIPHGTFEMLLVEGGHVCEPCGLERELDTQARDRREQPATLVGGGMGMLGAAASLGVYLTCAAWIEPHHVSSRRASVEVDIVACAPLVLGTTGAALAAGVMAAGTIAGLLWLLRPARLTSTRPADLFRDLYRMYLVGLFTPVWVWAAFWAALPLTVALATVGAFALQGLLFTSRQLFWLVFG